MLADVIYYSKMTSFMVLDGVMLLLLLKGVTIVHKRMQRSLRIGGSSLVQLRKVEEAEGFKCVFIVYCVLESK